MKGHCIHVIGVERDEGLHIRKIGSTLYFYGLFT
jgi:hypothetical protein